MNIASLVFLQHASDILTELINDSKLSPYRAYLIEIGTNIQDIHKKLSRLKINGIDDEICEHTDNTQKYINQIMNILQQKLVTKIRYSELLNGCKLFTLYVMVDFAFGMYRRQPDETRYYRDNFEKLKKSVENMIQKFDCLMNDNDTYLSVPEIDIALEPFCLYLEKVIRRKK